MQGSQQHHSKVPEVHRHPDALPVHELQDTFRGTSKEATKVYVFSHSELKVNAEVTAQLLRRGIMIPQEIDSYISKLIAGSSHVNFKVLKFKGGICKEIS